MTDSTSSSIVIAASPDKVLAVIADFPAYPEWAGVKEASVVDPGDGPLARSVQLTIDAGIVKDTYTLDYTWADDGVSWVLTKGTLQKGQRGSYRLTPEGEGTRVDYELSVDLAIPIPGMFKRKAEKVIVDTALKGLQKRVQSL